MGNSRVIHRSYSGITREQARDARARALAYAFSCYLAKQKAAERAGGKDDAKLAPKEGRRT